MTWHYSYVLAGPNSCFGARERVHIRSKTDKEIPTKITRGRHTWPDIIRLCCQVQISISHVCGEISSPVSWSILNTYYVKLISKLVALFQVGNVVLVRLSSFCGPQHSPIIGPHSTSEIGPHCASTTRAPARCTSGTQDHVHDLRSFCKCCEVHMGLNPSMGLN